MAEQRLRKESTGEQGRGERLDQLDQLRAAIDLVDQDIIALLNKRAGYSLSVGEIKRDEGGPVLHPERERQILDRLVATSAGPLPAAHIQAIYHEIFSSSRALQQPQSVAYLGPAGTFSHTAAMQFLGRSLDYQPQASIPDVFLAVASKACHYGMVPIENSLNGGVGQSIDSFLRYDVNIAAEMFSRIRHNIFSREQRLSDVKVVYSHAQALGQCAGWLRANLPGVRQIPTESSADAAARASKEDGSAAIGHPILKEMLGLNCLAQSIEDAPDNWTRFFIISNDLAKPDVKLTVSQKSTVLFTTSNKPGSLSAILEHLARWNINLSKLESRPYPHKRWDYIFFADLDCPIGAEHQAELLQTLETICPIFRVLGTYPSGPYLDAHDSGDL